MKTVKSNSKREIITYQFQPDQRFDTIKRAIIKRYRQNLPSKLPVGGLPSPPIDEKPRLSSKEIMERIKALQDEKHRLFQMIKQLVEQDKLKQQQQQQQQEQEQQLQQKEREEEQQRVKKRRKKTRWSPPENPIYFYERQQTSFYYPSKTQQQQQQQQQQQRYQLPPYSK